MKAIILCGGGGTRLWPESTPKQPKQFLKIHSENSLLAETVLRLLPIMRAEDMVVLTGDAYREQAVEELANIGCEAAHVVCEPCARNTAPAIALGVTYIKEKLLSQADETIFVAPSDHIISNRREFYHCLRLAEPLAQAGWFVTFGVVPYYPEVGYGYIEAARNLASVTRLVVLRKSLLVRSPQNISKPETIIGIPGCFCSQRAAFLLNWLNMLMK